MNEADNSKYAVVRQEWDAVDRAAALNHPHICTIHEIGEHAGQRFIAMEPVRCATQSAAELRADLQRLIRDTDFGRVAAVPAAQTVARSNNAANKPNRDPRFERLVKRIGASN